MKDLLLRIFDALRRHRLLGLLSFVLGTAVMVLLLLRLDYKEDIADFLPIDGKHRAALGVYQDISGGDRFIALFQCRDSLEGSSDDIIWAIDDFLLYLQAADTAGLVKDVVAGADVERFMAQTDFVMDNVPYFLTADDYGRIDSLLAQPDFVARRLHENKQQLLLPGGGLLAEQMKRDPLGLFSPLMQRLQGRMSEGQFELVDDYIFTPDLSTALVMLRSPYGGSETEQNLRLLKLLQGVADSTMAAHEKVALRFVGAPVIAVGNAQQIKTDCLLSVALAVGLTLLLLFYAFRGVGNLLLIALSVAWGWLFAMAGMALLHDSVSLIVIGISSVILGIAINYPLHMIAHLRHAENRRSALREIIAPLLVGNVTTVGAFLTLVPLQAVALRDLGLFAAFLLVGTMLFVLLYLPHVARAQGKERSTFLDKLASVQAERHGWLVAVVAVLTLVFAWSSRNLSFDANMSHINYMTPQQRSDMMMLAETMGAGKAQQSLYLLSSGQEPDAALQHNFALQEKIDELVQSGKVQGQRTLSDFVVPLAEEKRRLALWENFKTKHAEALSKSLPLIAEREGFSSDAFAGFYALLQKDCSLRDFDFFKPLAENLFAHNISCDSLKGDYHVVDVLSVAADDLQAVKAELQSDDVYAFDLVSLNSKIAVSLSDNFGYIGWACACIVFLFLWLSMGSIELAIISFVPMAVSWLWILGIMSVFGLQFNIVNIILATFIFGQGDDYTIFMTEGVAYEYAYRRKVLASYKRSIILSALIMFVGIGVLIFAKHPALYSLAQVTIVGMFSVVLMAYLFPPFLFNLLVKKNGEYRRRPLSLSLLFEKIHAHIACHAVRRPLSGKEAAGDAHLRALSALVLDRYRYKGADVFRSVKRTLRHAEALVAQHAPSEGVITLRDESYGELALLLALLHPQCRVEVTLRDADAATLLRYSAEGIVDNITSQILRQTQDDINSLK